MLLISQLFPPPRALRALAWGGVAALLFASVGCAALGGGQGAKPNPDRLARQALDSIGGARALNAARFWRWDYVVVENGVIQSSHGHIWDRRTGRYRLEASGDGNLLIVLFNLTSRQGIVYQNGMELPPSAQAPVIAKACAWHLSDAGWLLALTRLFDPGVHREFAGEMKIGSETLPTLRVWADAPEGSEPTTMDQWWLHLDPLTHRPVAWSFAPRGEAAPLLTMRCVQWQTLGRLAVPVQFELAGSKRRVMILDLYQPTQVVDSVFATPGMSATNKIRAPKDASGMVSDMVQSRKR